MLTLAIRSNISSSIVSSGKDGCATPVLLTSMSRPPKAEHEFLDDAFAKSRPATGDDGDLPSKSHICSSVARTIGEDTRVAQSDYLNALLAFLV
ncbi:hypothetical protein [Mesorhizobium sp. B263B2A]|uniref:hypothetical protein n=1 Tax=Mesorhizobium sp. B263B2A TaxID=2876669 RepID=UPI001CD12479|nr:hypothetical protein [Mesorhizobium sp. B263B2A]MCA0030175.1 hypothetical protein [Mesorhizobium sp. B263B2A]